MSNAHEQNPRPATESSPCVEASDGALTRAIWWLFPSRMRDDLRRELDIEYAECILPARGRRAAGAWYFRQLLGSLVWSVFHNPPRLATGRQAMDSLLTDLRFALRSFRRARGMAALAVLTVALGVGASTVVFSVLDAIVLEPLPYPDSQRIVRVWHGNVVSKATMEQVMAGTESFDPLVGTTEALRTLTDVGDPEELTGLTVTRGYWRLLGALPVAGALPPLVDPGPGDESTVVISHSLWRRKFGGDPEIAGRTIRLDGAAVTVVGVMAAQFRPLERAIHFWAPMVIDRDDFSDYEGTGQVRLVGRLAAGADLASATADTRQTADLIHLETPGSYSEEWAVESAPRPLHGSMIETASPALWTTMGAVLLVLLIACANVANLLLARAGSRQREMAIRVGLGAARSRIIRQLLTESLLLGLAGGLIGALAAVWATRSVVAAWARVLPRVDAVEVDGSMLLFALVATVAAALLFGIAPALRASVLTPREHLADGGNASTSARNRRIASTLVVAEVALAVVLVTGAGLMLRTLGALVAVEPGFDAADVSTFRLRIPQAAADTEGNAEAQAAGEEESANTDTSTTDPATFMRLVGDNLAALPGVESVGATTFLPMATGTPQTFYWRAETGKPEGQAPPRANFQLVSGDYFRTMRIPLLRGRLLGPEDADGEFVGVINATMARDAFGNENPIGGRLVMFGDTEFEVVGVVGDSHQRSPDQEPAPEAFFSFARSPMWPNMFLTVRHGTPAPSAELLRQAVWEVDASVPLLSLRPMEQVVQQASGRTRLFARALGAFGVLALVLAAVGVYGVTRHSLGQQVREFGIRIALGATPARIVREALAGSLRSVALGAAIGIGAALGLSRLMQGLLYGVSPIDPLTFVMVPLVLVGVGLVAAWLPARKAAATNPKDSLMA